MNSKSTIYIYNDLGASPNMVRHTMFSLNKFYYNNQIKLLNSESLITENWQNNASLFVMPGGADLPYVQKLSGQGNDMIKDYVINGGSYLGICAGAYYSSNYIEFDKFGDYEVLGERELKFFPGKSIGPVLAKFSYFSNAGERAAEIKVNMTNFETVKVYYNGGGYFENAETYPDIEVVARYKENNLASIIKRNFGKGKVILSAVHFEVDPMLFDNNDAHSNKVKSFLQENDAHREELLMDLLGDILSNGDYQYCDNLELWQMQNLKIAKINSDSYFLDAIYRGSIDWIKIAAYLSLPYVQYYLQTIMGSLIQSEAFGLIKNNALVMFKSGLIAIEGVGLNIPDLISLGTEKEEVINILASTSGRIVDIRVNPGDIVEVGRQLLVIEIMKMYVTVDAPHGGIVNQVNFQAGEMVEVGAELIGMVYNMAVDSVN